MSANDIASALRAATATLAAATIPSARLDAEVLLADILALSRTELLLRRLPGPLTADQASAYHAVIARRARFEPVAYITGVREFWSLTFHVGPGVLIPRPDSEVLIETALAHFKTTPPRTILDLGTGPGTLLLSGLSAFPDASGLGIDASEAALGYARENAQALGLDARAQFQPGNWTDGLDAQFDLIFCNPPYVARDAVLMPDVAEYEPPAALFAGIDGLDAYRIILPALPARLAPDGIALVEFGAGQAADVMRLAESAGLEGAVYPDLAGHLRCASLRVA